MFSFNASIAPCRITRSQFYSYTGLLSCCFNEISFEFRSIVTAKNSLWDIPFLSNTNDRGQSFQLLLLILTLKSLQPSFLKIHPSCRQCVSYLYYLPTGWIVASGLNSLLHSVSLLLVELFLVLILSFCI